VALYKIINMCINTVHTLLSFKLTLHLLNVDQICNTGYFLNVTV